MTTTTHYISTSIAHWKFLREGSPMDLQPKPVPFFQHGDIVIYKTYGDTYNEQTLKMRIVEIIDGEYLGAKEHTLLVLDHVDRQGDGSYSLVDLVMHWIFGLLLIILIIKIIVSIIRLFF